MCVPPRAAWPEAGEGLDKVWDRPIAHRCKGEHPSFHSLVLLGDLKVQGKQTPWSLHGEGEKQSCSGRWGSHGSAPRAHQHRPEISSLLPLSLRKPGPSPTGEALGAGAARCPHRNALKLPAEDLCVSNSFPGPPGFGLGSASTFPSCPLRSVLPHTPNLVIFPGFSMQNAHSGPAFALQVSSASSQSPFHIKASCKT